MKRNFTSFPELGTERLTLRQLSLSDESEVFFQRSDKEMNKYVGNPPCRSLEEARAWIEKINGFAASNESIYWAVCIKGTEKMIGGFCFWNISEEKNSAEIGFTMLPQYQGRGYMSEVLRAALNYGFEQMGAACIEGYTHPDNIPSIRVMEKNGFRPKEVQPGDAGEYVVYELCR